MKSIARVLESIVLGCRWLVVPFLLGLVVGLVALLVKFVVKLIDFVMGIFAAEPWDALSGILNLVDLTPTANLIVIVVSASYNNVVASVADHPECPPGLVKIGFSGLKQRLLGSIVAIAAVSALEWFVDIDRHIDGVKLSRVVGIFLASAVAALVLAAADHIALFLCAVRADNSGGSPRPAPYHNVQSEERP